MNKWGHWKEVHPYGHRDVARKLISDYLEKTGEDIAREETPYRTLYRHGYIRIVVEDDYDKIYWAHSSKGFTPTQSQQKFLNELGRVYNLPVERDPDYTREH